MEQWNKATQLSACTERIHHSKYAKLETSKIKMKVKLMKHKRRKWKKENKRKSKKVEK